MLNFVLPYGTTDTFEYMFLTPEMLEQKGLGINGLGTSDGPEDFWEWLNVPPEHRGLYTVGTPQNTYIFPNVWNRRDLYIHASFVNYTAYGYLGRDGEFYPKPSKIYQFDWQPMQFFFEVSFDGMTPVELPYERFEVELSFIIDDKRYQSQ
jgi:hypothetical protein